MKDVLILSIPLAGILVATYLMLQHFHNKNIHEKEKLIKDLLQNPKNLVEASNQLKKLSNRLEKLRDNKTPTEFLSECILKLINDNKKVIPTTC